MSALAEAVLPLIRTRSDLHRWSAANQHGGQMHAAVDILEVATATADPSEVYSVVRAALASAVKVIARADDSSGIIGEACRRLLDMHPRAAAAAQVAPGKLVEWMIKFQFDGDVDYFEIDPVAYAPALGETGMAAYRMRLDEIAAGLSPPDNDELRSYPGHDRFTLDWNARRLAVFDRNIDEIIRTHARDRKVAAWLHDTAEAFQRWPTASTAAQLHRTAGSAWPAERDGVFDTLAARPDQAVLFALGALKDPQLAWNLTNNLRSDDDHTWAEVANAYETVDPLATLPIHQRLVEHELVNAGAQHYRLAARRLARMRKLATGTDQADTVDALIANLRETHRRRPRLQQEFDRAGLP